MLIVLLVTLCVPQVGFSQVEEKKSKQQRFTLKQKATVIANGVLGSLGIGYISYMTYFLTDIFIRGGKTARYISYKMETMWPRDIKKYLRD